MKKLPFTSLVAALATLFSLSAQAVVYDGFEEYPDGSLQTNDGGVGWSDAWIGSTGSAQVASQSLSYSSGDISINGGDKAMRQGLSSSTDNTSYQTRRSFETAYNAATTDTFYMSFLINSPTLNDPSTTDYFSIWLSADKQFGAIIRSGDIRGVAPNHDEVTSGIDYVNGSTFLIVVKVSSDGITSGDFYDRNDIFINPTSLTEPVDSDVTVASASSTIDTIDTFGVRFALFEANTDVVYLDNVKIGDTWESVVTGIPEANASWMLGLAAASLLVLRRKRQG